MAAGGSGPFGAPTPRPGDGAVLTSERKFSPRLVKIWEKRVEREKEEGEETTRSCKMDDSLFNVALAIFTVTLVRSIYAYMLMPHLYGQDGQRTEPLATRPADAPGKQLADASSNGLVDKPLALPAPVIAEPAPSTSHILNVAEFIPWPLMRCLGPCLGLEPEMFANVFSDGAGKQLKTSPRTATSPPASPTSIATPIDMLASAKPSDAPRAVLPPVHTSLASAAFLSHPELAFHLLRLTANGGAYGENEDIPRCLQLCDAVLERGEPLLALYDLSKGRLPPFGLGRTLLHTCLLWADEHASAWDAQVQGMAFVVPNAFVRGFLNMVKGVVNPPQPLRYCADEREALTFLSAVRCARSYQKASYQSAAKAGL